MEYEDIIAGVLNEAQTEEDIAARKLADDFNSALRIDAPRSGITVQSMENSYMFSYTPKRLWSIDIKRLNQEYKNYKSFNILVDLAKNVIKINIKKDEIK